jgi:hypothetical protein
MTVPQSKSEMLQNLREMLRDVFRLRSEGTAYARLSRAHGYADGCMRVILDAGIADQAELLRIVAEERARAEGPATAVVEPDIARVA